MCICFAQTTHLLAWTLECERRGEEGEREERKKRRSERREEEEKRERENLCCSLAFSSANKQVKEEELTHSITHSLTPSLPPSLPVLLWGSISITLNFFLIPHRFFHFPTRGFFHFPFFFPLPLALRCSPLNSCHVSEVYVFAAASSCLSCAAGSYSSRNGIALQYCLLYICIFGCNRWFVVCVFNSTTIKEIFYRILCLCCLLCWILFEYYWSKCMRNLFWHTIQQLKDSITTPACLQHRLLRLFENNWSSKSNRLVWPTGVAGATLCQLCAAGTYSTASGWL